MKLHRVLICLLVAVAVGGCSNSPSQTGSGVKGKSGKLVGISLMTINNPFFVDLSNAAKGVVEKNGGKMVIMDSQSNSMKQKNDLSDLMLQRPACIMVNPVNWEGIRGSLIEARKRNVPVIVVDAPVKDENLVMCMVASDNFKAGQLVAEAVAKSVKDAKILILQQSIAKPAIDRVAGFKSVVAKNPGMKIIDIQECKGTTESARPVARDLMGRHPDANVIFAINDPSALGAISALESAGKAGAVKVVGVDGSAEAIAAIKSGKMLATAAQFPKEIGETAAKEYFDYIAGKKIPKNVKIRVALITRENVDSFGKQK